MGSRLSEKRTRLSYQFACPSPAFSLPQFLSFGPCALLALE